MSKRGTMKTILKENTRMHANTSEVLVPYLDVTKTDTIFDYEIYDARPKGQRFLRKAKIWLNCGFWKVFISPLILAGSVLLYAFAPPKVFNGNIKPLFLASLNESLKRLFDILGALVGLILTSVLFLIISILIKLDSKGPVFYTQLRVGQNQRRRSRRKLAADIYTERRNGDRRNVNLNGRPFTIYKFRTMREDAEKKCGPVWASDNDPRITSVGRILRYLHLDELPQLINILKGDMSFVGPRPERPYFVTQFAAQIPKYNERLNIKPGLTGLAQIKCGYDQSVESVKTKLLYDLYYCQKNSFYHYMKILLLTIFRTVLNKIKELF